MSDLQAFSNRIVAKLIKEFGMTVTRVDVEDTSARIVAMSGNLVVLVTADGDSAEVFVDIRGERRLTTAKVGYHWAEAVLQILHVWNY